MKLVSFTCIQVLYNDSSSMEHHHLAAAFALMKEDSCNFLQHMPVRQKSEMRKMVIEAVMATDMKQHFSLSSLFNTKFSSTTETAVGHATVVRRSLMSSRDLSAGLDGELRSLVLQIAMKCADLGALAAARKVHVQWVQRLEEEFFRQGDQEHRLSLQKSPLMDRSKDGLSKAQPQVSSRGLPEAKFFSMVALPLFKSFVAIFPDCSPLLENTNGNLDM
ncbi:hypothetical protein CEUSTIGMA_g6613.t1 [Chlamydomonas eustigma]|uniref:PDEase domain-containing protein n=1 Tax=Chlamydomonas eustigma TaxID=1157962 RepID=A0A250X7X3_9CHLO|nr:hypothetical protein CEUSTIGMA_g6613.t1 [Chlamydomonas eustigma]|eukprot:GAX79173.1 hypothetical protein CEUSTIGMA_g6613.t1 [Chlamydomonas eustigma]